MRKAWAGLFVAAAVAVSFFIFYWTVAAKRPTLRQTQAQVCELARVVYENTLSTRDIAQDVIDDPLHETIAATGFYREIRLLESLPCNLQENP